MYSILFSPLPFRNAADAPHISRRMRTKWQTPRTPNKELYCSCRLAPGSFFKKKCFQKKDWRRRAAAGRNETRNHAVRRCSNKTSRRMNPQHLLLLRPPVLPAAPRHGLPARRQPVAPARRRKPSGGLASIPQSKPELRACDLAGWLTVARCEL